MPPGLAEQIDAEFGKRWYSRRQPALAQLYDARSETAHWQDAGMSSRTAGIVYMGFFFTDLILISDVAYYSIATRILIGLTFIFVIGFQIKSRVRSIYVDCQCALGIVAAYSSWMWLCSLSSYQVNSSYYLTYGIIFIVGQNVFFNFRFGLAVVSSSVMLAVFAVLLFQSFFYSLEYVAALGALYLSTYTLTLFVNWKLNEERYQVFLNSLHAELRQEEAVERGAALLRLSTTDALTGLANRRAIDEELRTFWSNWQDGEKSFGVILIDVDYFKRYNDQYGHQQGDRCLIAVAAAMRAATAHVQCTLGRFGGEEFILLVRCQTREHMALAAEGVRRAIEDLQIRHEQRPDPSFVVTVSLGAALCRDITGAKVERLITEADRALYVAKKSGRNCVRVFDRNDPQEVNLDETVEALLRTATADGRVAMVYQPIRDARSGAIVGAEALMRLTSAGGKSISPAVFIPIAERMGTIVELGHWAIRTVCRDLIANDRMPLVSVNVSAVQLSVPSFALSVATILSETGVAPHRLVVEITEGLQIEGQPDILRSIGELRLLGVKIWLDDFGTGFAGLSCIREIAFDAIKIDRSFLQATATPKGADMFRNIVDLVRSVGCQTLVEGIERPEQRDLAAALQVDLLQGYHLGKPMPAAALRVLIDREAPHRDRLLQAP
ncbi:MAG: GGDEF domain-containing protein [Methylobacterium sp.]